MKNNKIFLMMFLSFIIFSLCAACSYAKNSITITNKTSWIFDNINIPVKEGYFYDTHDKFTVDEDTVGVTIYFTKEKALDNWE